MKKSVASVVAVLALASYAQAGDMTQTTSKEMTPMAPPVPLFRTSEIQFDVFGEGDPAIHHPTHDREYFHSSAGGGIGVNYFFLKYFGVGVRGDFDTSAPKSQEESEVSGNVILRLPIELSHFGIAPYIFGGGGGNFTADDKSDAFYEARHGLRHRSTIGSEDVGAGVEVRVNPHVGIFADGTYQFDGRDTNDVVQIRSGVRIAF